jgi:hypothetical protein
MLLITGAKPLGCGPAVSCAVHEIKSSYVTVQPAVLPTNVASGTCHRLDFTCVNYESGITTVTRQARLSQCNAHVRMRFKHLHYAIDP